MACSQEIEITKYVDKDSALSRVRGNKPLYRKMLNMLLGSGEFDKLEDALARQDIPGAADAAHTIKGISGNLSLPLLFELCTKLMDQLRQGNADVPLIEEYRAALAETLVFVREIVAELDNETA